MVHSKQGPQSDLTKLKDVLDEYASVRGSLITILQKAQEIYGYLPKDVMYHIADKTGVSPAEVLGVATFYAQFRLQPIGKYLLMSCRLPRQLERTYHHRHLQLPRHRGRGDHGGRPLHPGKGRLPRLLLAGAGHYDKR